MSDDRPVKESREGATFRKSVNKAQYLPLEERVLYAYKNLTAVYMRRNAFKFRQIIRGVPSVPSDKRCDWSLSLHLVNRALKIEITL